MKKLLLSFSFISLIAYDAQEEKKQFVHITYNPNNGFWQQLTTKRPAEQDVRTEHRIPTFVPSLGGKQLEVNWSQLGNVGKALCALYAGHLINKHKPQTSKSDPALINDLSYKLKNEQHYKLAIPLKSFLCVAYLNSCYKYLNGEQKMPFRIIDAEKATETQENKLS